MRARTRSPARTASPATAAAAAAADVTPSTTANVTPSTAAASSSSSTTSSSSTSLRCFDAAYAVALVAFSVYTSSSLSSPLSSSVALATCALGALVAVHLIVRLAALTLRAHAVDYVGVVAAVLDGFSLLVFVEQQQQQAAASRVTAALLPVLPFASLASTGARAASQLLATLLVADELTLVHSAVVTKCAELGIVYPSFALPAGDVHVQHSTLLPDWPLRASVHAAFHQSAANVYIHRAVSVVSTAALLMLVRVPVLAVAALLPAHAGVDVLAASLSSASSSASLSLDVARLLVVTAPCVAMLVAQTLTYAKVRVSTALLNLVWALLAAPLVHALAFGGVVELAVSTQFVVAMAMLLGSNACAVLVGHGVFETEGRDDALLNFAEMFTSGSPTAIALLPFYDTMHLQRTYAPTSLRDLDALFKRMDTTTRTVIAACVRSERSAARRRRR